MFPIAVYTFSPDWRRFFICKDYLWFGWGTKRIIVAWWLLNPFRERR